MDDRGRMWVISHVDALMYYIGDLAMLRDTRFFD